MITWRARVSGRLVKTVTSMSKPVSIPQSTIVAQRQASDPDASAWVAANAGSGKTHVLTQRVIRLMLSGNSPDRILCLTFTKAAAANMKNRVFDTLSKWTMLDEVALSKELEGVIGGIPADKTVRRARRLFAEALDTPGGLKIQTIHAFCESLLHQFTLEANVTAHFEVLQETAQAAMLADARSQILGNTQQGVVSDAFTQLIEEVNDAEIARGVSEIVAKRQRFLDWVSSADGNVNLAVDQLYPAFGVNISDTTDTQIASCLRTIQLHDTDLKEIFGLASSSDKKTDMEMHFALQNYFESQTPNYAFDALKVGLLTKTGTPKKRLLTRDVLNHKEDAQDILERCADIIVGTIDKINSLNALSTCRAMFTIAFAVLERFESMKRSRGLIDFDDQVERCVTLLYRKDIREWIRYRLDQGVDHLLVDEAQDTSPAQWKIINAISDDFYSGDNASYRDRSMFVVGDEKQSIYSFQGADPAEFSRQEKNLQTRAGERFRKTSLKLSFRSTEDVLKAVDQVFDIPENRVGLTQDGIAPPHDAIRSADPGEVQIWPVFSKQHDEEPEDWLKPVDSVGDPAVKLATRISKAIGDWVGKPLPGTGEPLKYGDILVLVRKRDRFITALARTMKDMGLAVAGADRLKLLEHIAVEDLLAVGKFALLPEDDLNLAGVLKSVFLGCSEDELFDLAYERGNQSLFDRICSTALDESAAGHGAALRILPFLRKVLENGRVLAPYDFFAWLLGQQEGRSKMLARLGAEAEDVLDSFMDEVLAFTHQGGMGLDVFIAELTKADPEIKRELDLDRDEVRILTVHASKGLEARVVFLVDPCSAVLPNTNLPRLLEIDTPGKGFLPFWGPRGAPRTQTVDAQLERVKAAADGEYRRLLYVGMTRAADRLIICGYRGTREPAHLHWHSMVTDALKPTATEMLDDAGNVTGYRWVSSKRDPLPPKTAKECEAETEQSVPNWVFEPASAEPPLPRPLTPSGAYALIDRDMKLGARPAFENASESHDGLEFGTAMHHLLEKVPGLPIEEYSKAVHRFCASLGAGWTEADRARLKEKALQILQNDKFRTVFSPDSQAEVSVVGSIMTKSGLRLISGQIDRLVVSRETVLIIDYKTNRKVPETPEEISGEYVTQLALYRHLVSGIYPDKRVVCALLWTSSPSFMELPDSILDKALSAVNKV